jgi:hypothetical protein
MVSLWWVTYPHRRWWSHYDGWPAQIQDDQNVNWSHCYGWPTQMEDGLIMMGDLPRWKLIKMWNGLIVMGDLPKWKLMVSLWWVTYPNKNWWSHYDGWPTWKEWWWKYEVVSLLWVTYPKKNEDGLIRTGDLPIEKMMVSLWWVTYADGSGKNVKWSHCNGWPTQMKDGLIMMGDLPKWKIMVSLWWVTYPGKWWFF